MQNIIIEIVKDDVFSEVSLASNYAGAKAEQAGSPDFFQRIATVKADNELLQRFWDEMCGAVTEKLREMISSAPVSERSLKLNLDVSGSYDTSLNDSVRQDIFSAISAGIVCRWFRYTLPERAGEWQTRSESLLNRAFVKLCHRKKPVRPVRK